MTRSELLHAAEVCVCGQREEDYGTPEDSFRVIGELWETYIKEKCVGDPAAEVCIVPEDVAALLALLKIARIATGHGKSDNWVDLAGYAACGGELQSFPSATLPSATSSPAGASARMGDAINGAATRSCGNTSAAIWSLRRCKRHRGC